MHALIFEDDDSKFLEIETFVKQCAMKGHCLVERAKNINTGLVSIGRTAYDLVIVDLLMPQIEGGSLASNGSSILRAMEQAPHNYSTSIVAITKYPDEAEQNRKAFLDSGATILEYSPDSENWKMGLKFIINRIRAKIRFDFIAICALDKELKAFQKTPLKTIRHTTIHGIGVTEVAVGDLSGILVKQPYMGIVDAACYATQLLQLFSPKLIFMPGICGGIVEETKLGQIVVADPCWEYQSGKLTTDGLEPDNAPIRISESVRTTLQSVCDDGHLVKSCYDGFLNSDEIIPDPVIAQFASGSAVVSDLVTGKLIQSQQRKATGVDMEMFGFYRAAHLSRQSVDFFGAKVVVDHCNPDKNDSWQQRACVISARFCVIAAMHLLKK